MCKISIIIPVYNAESYLNQCLDTVINQSLDDIEIILINDGSTDNSLDICYKYSKKDSRVKVIDKKNEGPSVARNLGITSASGKYICFIDADDWIELDMCKKLYNDIEFNNADFIMCNFIKQTEGQEELIDSGINSKILCGKDITYSLIIPLIEKKGIGIHKLATFRGPWGKLYKRETILQNKISFKKDLIIGEDFMFNCEYLIEAKKVVINKEYFYNYRINNSSITIKYKENCLNKYKLLVNYLEKFLEKNKILSESIEELDKLKIKFSMLSINNECRNDNKKTFIEKIKSIKDLCYDDFVSNALNKYDKKKIDGYGKMLRLAKMKQYLVLYLYYKLKINK